MDSRKYLTNDERKHLENVLHNNLESDLRNVAMIFTALYSGARASELLGLTWQDINLATGEIHVRTLKRGIPRSVVVPKFIRDVLRLLQHDEPVKPFNISYPRLVVIWNLYRPVKKTFHSLRHTFAMRAYDKTKDIRFVKYALGHSNIQNTMIYADHAYTTAEFKKLMKVR